MFIQKVQIAKVDCRVHVSYRVCGGGSEERCGGLVVRKSMSAQDVAQISECLRQIKLQEQLRRERFWRRQQLLLRSHQAWTKQLYKDTNPLMSSLLVIFVWGGGSNFVGSESGQKQSVKLLQNMVYSTIQHPHPPPPQTHALYIQYI